MKSLKVILLLIFVLTFKFSFAQKKPIKEPSKTYTTTQNKQRPENQPDVAEAKSWILGKLNRYSYSCTIKSQDDKKFGDETVTASDFRFEGNVLVLTKETKSLGSIQGQNSIYVKEIVRLDINDFYNVRGEHGRYCKFLLIATSDGAVTVYNDTYNYEGSTSAKQGEKSITDFFSFPFLYESEPDLINRMQKALTDIKNSKTVEKY